MKIGFIGLGRMGKNMVLNALDKKLKIVAHNRSPEAVDEVVAAGAIGAYTIDELFNHLKGEKVKVVWLMLTAGSLVDDKIKEIIPYLSKGDLIIDGGNSWYEDSIRRHEMLSKKGLGFLDIGTSGGIGGARHGACMMAGGKPENFKIIEPFVRELCVKNGYAHVGGAGAGHFVKMMHNGIEYGMMAALGEGFEALHKQKGKFNFDLKEIAKVYAHGSIIEGKLASWLESGLNRDDFEDISGSVPKGETEDEMEKLEGLADMPVLHTSRMQRVNSRKRESFAGKIVATLRNEFGGHKVEKKK